MSIHIKHAGIYTHTECKIYSLYFLCITNTVYCPGQKQTYTYIKFSEIYISFNKNKEKYQ